MKTLALLFAAVTGITCVGASAGDLADVRRHTYKYEATLTNDLALIQGADQRVSFVRAAAEAALDRSKPSTVFSNAAFRKSAAISYLGDTEGTNHMDVLLSQLSFSDPTLAAYPAVDAIVKKGQPAIAPLWVFIVTCAPARDHAKLASAGFALMGVLGKPEYIKWIRERRGQLPPHTYQILEAVYEVER